MGFGMVTLYFTYLASHSTELSHVHTSTKAINSIYEHVTKSPPEYKVDFLLLCEDAKRSSMRLSCNAVVHPLAPQARVLVKTTASS